ncbi:thioredoxin [Lutimonas sp.]|uniref:thioredoxin n=1 Tax=Lutimonas sp. TaxID=1872403 RepID=UPI003D9BAB6D
MNIHLSENDFKQTLETNQAVVIDFYADWCGPCNALSPTVEKLASEFEGEVSIKKVNVDDHKALAHQFGVRSIPTLVYFSNGEEVNRSNGVLSENQLRAQIQQLKTA